MAVTFYDENGDEVDASFLVPPAFTADDKEVSTYDVDYSWTATLDYVEPSSVSSVTNIYIGIACSEWTGYTRIVSEERTHSQVVSTSGVFTDYDILVQLDQAYERNNLRFENSEATTWTFRLTMKVSVEGTDSKGASVTASLEETAEFTIDWVDGEIGLTGYVGDEIS